MISKLANKQVLKSAFSARNTSLLKQSRKITFLSNNARQSKYSKSKQYTKFYITTAVVASATTWALYNVFDNGTDNRIDNEAVKSGSTKFRKVTPEEVAKHNKADDCWVVIDNKVYDLTDFIPNHPGGPLVIRTNAGKDVSAIFKPLHAPGTIEKNIPDSMHMGELTKPMPASLVCPPYAPGETPEEIMAKEQLRSELPPLDNVVNVYDFEELASKILSNQAWAYYSSAADDEITCRENHNAYHRIFFKPKVLVDVKHIDTETEFFGKKSDVPFYVSATALCKLGNPTGGEMDIARGCGMTDTAVPQMISTLASCSVDEIHDAKIKDDQMQWFQLYVNSDRKVSRELIRHIESLGLDALFITVDAPSLGHREKDLKIKFSNMDNGPKIMQAKDGKPKKENGASRALSKFIDPSLTWEDVKEIKKFTKLPVVIKGVQRVEDAVKAAEIGCDGVVLSNHGGRQLDFSRAPIEVLAETMPVLKKRGLDKNFSVFIDGGIRRGTDILKALCLGATGVGLGRPFLYANSCYGKDGVAKAVELLKSELEMSMRLLGVSSLKELNPDLLDLTTLKARSVQVASDNLYTKVYKSPTLASFPDQDDS